MYIKLLKYISKYKSDIIIIFIKSILLSVLITILGMCIPLMSQKLIDEGIMRKDLNNVLLWSLFILIFGMISEIFQVIQNVIHIHMENSILEAMSEEAFDHILKLKMKYFENSNFFENICAVNDDIANLVDTFNKDFFNVFTNTLKIFGGIIGLSFISIKLLGIIIICAIAKAFLINKIAVKKTIVFEKNIKINKEYSRWYSEAINGIKIIKLNDLFYNFKNVFHELIIKKIYCNNEFMKIEMIGDEIDSFFELFIDFIIYIIGTLIIINGELSIGGLISFTAYSSMILQPIFLIMNLKYKLAKIKPAFDDYIKFLELEEENYTTANKLKIGDVGDVQKTFIFKNVTVRVENKKILENINLEIHSGEKIGIIGYNGSGKTTFINSILRLKELASGEICFMDMNIEKINLSEYRKLFSVISQDVFLFNTTVKENLFCKYEENEIKKLVENIGMNELFKPIFDFEKGLSTNVGVRGSKLSGGEKQKVELLREVLKQSKVLIFDEATSNYDISSEQIFNNSIANYTGFLNIFLITHKPDILKHLDKIIVLNKGKIIAFGTYEELFENNSQYINYIKEEK